MLGLILFLKQGLSLISLALPQPPSIVVLLSYKQLLTGMVVHLGSEGRGGCLVQGQPGLHNTTPQRGNAVTEWELGSKLATTEKESTC